MPVEALTKKIRGDWFPIREHIDDLYELEEVFAFSASELASLVEALRTSVEHGIIEYKRRYMQGLFAYLDALKYDTKGFDELTDRARESARVLFAVLIQRLISTGAVPIRAGEQPHGEHETESAGTGAGMKEILQEVQERIKSNPEMKQHPAVKNIFMQVNIYRKELDNMKKLAPNIPPEKQQSFYANFKKSFDQITEKIREQYRIIEREDQAEAAKSVDSVNPLKNHDLGQLAKLFEDQAKEYSVVRSALNHAAEERYKTREILATVTERKDRLELLVETEQQRYGELEPGEGGSRSVGRAFGAEVVTVLKRQISRMR